MCWKGEAGQTQDRQMPAATARKWHFSASKPHGRQKKTSPPPSEHLSSFVCSEVRHADGDPIKNPKQMRDSGGGKQVEKEKKEKEKKLKVFQAIAETIQLPCLSNLASQVIVSNCLTKIDTSVATV